MIPSTVIHFSHLFFCHDWNNKNQKYCMTYMLNKSHGWCGDTTHETCAGLISDKNLKLVSSSFNTLPQFYQKPVQKYPKNVPLQYHVVSCSYILECFERHLLKCHLWKATPLLTIESFMMIWLSSVLRPRQHSIGYMGDGFYRSKDPTSSIKVLKEKKEYRLCYARSCSLVEILV